MISLKKILVITFFTLVVVAGLFYLHSWFYTSTVTISSAEGAEIYVKQSGADYRLIGIGRAIFKTRGTDIMFIESRQDASLTQKAIKPKRRTTIEVGLNLKTPADITSAAPGPFIDPLIEGGFIYGINNRTRSLDIKNLTDEGAVKPIVPLLPYLKQIAWRDSHNFIYITASKGAGVVSTDAALSAEGLPYIGVSVLGSDSTALLSSKGLHLARGLDIKNAVLVSGSSDNTVSYLSSDDRYVFFGWIEFEKAEQETQSRLRLSQPEEIEEHDPSILGTKLQIFSHSGQKKHDLSLDIQDQVINVLSLDDKTLMILTTDGIYSLDLDTNSVNKINFSFGEVRDMVIYKDRLLLLGEEGLWEYSPDNEELYRLAYYSDGLEYVPNSLTVSGDTLYFGGALSREILKYNPANQSGQLYKVKLND